MTIGSGGDQGPRPASGTFDFGLVPSSQAAAEPGNDGQRRDRRRRSGPDRSVIVRAVVIVGLSVALIAGAGLVALTMVQSSEDKVKADSAAFCADLATTPGVLSQPAFGWPTEVADIPTTVAAMVAYQDRWANLAKIGPPSIRADLQAVATAAGTIASSVETNQSINRPGTLASMEGVTAQTIIPAWAAKYCD